RFFSSTHYVYRIFGFANDQIANHIRYPITEHDLLPMPKPIRDNYPMNAGEIRMGKSFITAEEVAYSTNSHVRQLPITIRILGFTL
ncbi:hypothetical protein, partial [Fluoribacter gormanii]